jgi:hypothetical protein
MNNKEYSLKILTKTGSNILDPDYFGYKSLERKLGRAPILTDFDRFSLNSYAEYQAMNELKAILTDPTNTIHIRFNHGARAGSIARVSNPADIFRSDTTGYRGSVMLDWDCKLEVVWDDKKTWKFKFTRHIDAKVVGEGKHHDFLINYAGPSVKSFEKKERVELPPAYVEDAYGREIRVGTWVLDNRFKLGRIERISHAGTLWIDFLQQSLGSKYAVKGHVQQFGRSSRELLVMELPDGFETTAIIMDKDIRDFVITPTFRFGYE